MGWIITILIVVGIACLLVVRKKESPPRATASTSNKTATITRGKYHSISINPGEGACSTVRELGKKRFLANEAPTLPLAGCDADSCACHYIHHEDRRSGTEDRRAEHSLRTELYGSVEDESDRREKGPDRRKS